MKEIDTAPTRASLELRRPADADRNLRSLDNRR
jgi:hypothetical protein